MQLSTMRCIDHIQIAYTRGKAVNDGDAQGKHWGSYVANAVVR